MPLSAAQCHQNALCPNRLIGYHCRRTIEKVEIKKLGKRSNHRKIRREKILVYKNVPEFSLFRNFCPQRGIIQVLFRKEYRHPNRLPELLTEQNPNRCRLPA